MSIFTQDLALQRTIADYCDLRTKIINELDAGYKALANADQISRQFYEYGLPTNSHPRDSLSETIRNLDRRLWTRVFDQTGLSQFMDAKARKEFDRELELNPPKFTEKNVRDNLMSAASNTDAMFARGLFNLFKDLSGRYKSNDAFKIGKKFILGYAASSSYARPGALQVNHHRSDTINDLDRVVKTLVGAKFTSRELEHRINKGFIDNDNLFIDEHYKIRGFKNGNMHIELTGQEIRDKVNKVIAEYCGEVLPDAMAA